MTLKEVMSELQSMGSASTKNTHMNHGAPEPLFGVKVGDMKNIVKKVKKDHPLALELFATGNSDAMYLAGLISDPAKMTTKDLQSWAEQATWHMISEYSVAWTAAESPHALPMAAKWINSKNERIASTGWSTLSSYISITPEDDLDMVQFKSLLERVEKNIHAAQNRVRSTMNGFIIAVGSGIPALTIEAIRVAGKVGTVYVDMGGTACKVPDAAEYINKIKLRGAIGKKKKTAKC